MNADTSLTTASLEPTSAYTGRLAPSPTGLLHLGHAATFLLAHDRARAANGQLLLRIDDLDPQRSKEQFVAAARADLRWLGLSWTSECRQSERLPLYRAALDQLLTRGLAYPCTCTRRDLQQAIAAPHEDTDDEPVYNGRCRPRISTTKHRWNRTNYRFRVPDGATITFVDGNCGPQSFTPGCGVKADFGDFLLWRKDGLPSYQLACAVDDAGLRITEIVRGRDLLKSTARQVLLQQALGLPTPLYFHTDLLRDEQGQRLAKRHDALSLQTLRATGLSALDLRKRLQR